MRGDDDDDSSGLASGSGDDGVANTAEPTVSSGSNDGTATVSDVDNVDASDSSSGDDSSDAGATVGYIFLTLFIIGGLVGGVIYARKNRLSLPSLPSLSSCFGSSPASNNHTPFQISNPMYGGAAQKKIPGSGSSTFLGLDASVA